MIREVLCNAWDAHIVSDRRHLPVMVEITADKLVIRDYGYGIPHELIHGIYCVYGNSTKENDGNQTGGFGLGSKAPFAYSDHFTVSNHHEGQKIVHAISRGSARTMGKPDRRTIVSVRTQESGVEVMVPVKSQTDANLFIKLVQDVAGFGEMNVLLNGKPVKTQPISLAENNMFLTMDRPGSLSINKVNVRYGNVVYPVPPHADYIGIYEELIKALKQIPNRSHYRSDDNEFALIMQAPANAISVTPSRESLSLTETSCNTLKKLMKDMIDFLSSGSQHFETLLLQRNEEAIQHMFRTGYTSRILFSENLIKDPKFDQDMGGFHDECVYSMEQLAHYYLKYQRKFSDRLIQLMHMQRVNALLNGGFRRRTDLLKYARFYDNKWKRNHTGKAFLKHILRPMVSKISKVVNGKHLYVINPNGGGRLRSGWVSAAKFVPSGRYEEFNLLSGVVIIAHNRLAVEQDFTQIMGRKINDFIDMSKSQLVYVAPRTKGVKETAIAEFERLGYMVLDFAEKYDAYKAKFTVVKGDEDDRPVTIRERAPKKIGLPLLKDNIRKRGFKGEYTDFVPNKHLTEDHPRSSEFKYVIRPTNLSGKGYYGVKFFPWGDSYGEEIASLFGSEIAICVSDPQMESQRKKGKGDGILHIARTVANEVLTNPGIRTYVENKLGEEETRGTTSQLIEMAQYSDAIRHCLGFTKVGTDQDMTIYNLFTYMANGLRAHYKYDANSWEGIIFEAKKVVDTWATPQSYVDLVARVERSTALEFLSLMNMRHELRTYNQEPKKLDIKKKIFIEMSIINALS